MLHILSKLQLAKDLARLHGVCHHLHRPQMRVRFLEMRSQWEALLQPPFSLRRHDLMSLTILVLFGQRVGNEGMKALAAALASGAFASLQTIYVDSRHVRYPALVEACKPRNIAIYS